MATATGRSAEEILARIASLEGGDSDWLGFERAILTDYLPFEHAKEFLKADVTAEQWDAARAKPGRDAIVAEMRNYMPFGWEKANGERGISAGRTISKFRAWLWMLGDDKTLAFLDDESNYAMYGKPMLRRICEVYGFPIEES